jgi:hypothetical protein
MKHRVTINVEFERSPRRREAGNPQEIKGAKVCKHWNRCFTM